MKYFIALHRLMFAMVLVVTFFVGAVDRAQEMMLQNLTTNELLGLDMEELSKVKAL